MSTSHTDRIDAGAMSTGATIWTWSALLVSLAGVAGTIYLSLGMSLIPCPLCYYQRTFMMAAFVVLALGILAGRQQTGFVSLLALPLALGGLGVAGDHVLREARGIMECPAGLLQIGSAPQQSLALFLILTILVLADVLQRIQGRTIGAPALVGGVILGAVLAVGSLLSAAPPDIPREGPLLGCRKPAAP